MKVLVFVSLAFSTAALLSAADSPSLSGDWKIQNSIAGNESEMACTLVQQDNKLTGKCTSENGSVDLAGKVDGKKVTFSFKVDHQGTGYTLEYEGVVDPATGIKGTVNVAEAGASGDFTAVLAK
jgi:hypothetical protein